MKKTADNKSGLIFNIQRFSVHDGAGIRDLVFLKGCPLRCLWCSNPESQNYHPEITLNKDRCIGIECGRCVAVCPTNAIAVQANEKISINWSLCNNCGECVEICPARAIKLFGERMSVNDIVKVVEEDDAFYWRSGGGITISGGDPLSQPDFVHDLLKVCRKRGIDTAVEIGGHASWEAVEKVCRYANLIFYDIKHLDPIKHETLTGFSNELVLGNIKKIARHFPETPIIARTPVVPGFIDSEEDIKAIADFLCGVESVTEYELLPYHGFGEPKYYQLGREYPLSELKPPSQEQMEKLKKIAQKVGVGCKTL